MTWLLDGNLLVALAIDSHVHHARARRWFDAMAELRSRLARPAGSATFPAMSITAIVENDTIKLPPGVHLPDGTRVKIEPTESASAGTPRRSLAERYAGFAGIADDVPADLARNLDHYIHGQPRQP